LYRIVFKAPVESDTRTNFGTQFIFEKKQNSGLSDFDDMFRHFDTMLGCNRRTHRQRHRSTALSVLCIASRG